MSAVTIGRRRRIDVAQGPISERACSLGRALQVRLLYDYRHERNTRGNTSTDSGAAALTLNHVEPVAMRVGDEERNAAATALGEHLTAGRIDLNEYGQRSAQAFAAHTEVDLQELFRDLPAPHPLAAGLATNPSGQSSTPRSATVRAHTGVLPGAEAECSIAERLAAVMLGITGMVTVVAFGALVQFWSGAWLVFLLIPALAAAAEATWGKGWRTSSL